MSERKGIQLAYPFEERRLLNQGRFQLRWSPPYLIQPKLNGERCRMIVESGRCLLLSSSEEIIPSVPHINAEGLNFPNGEYDGELYVHGWTFSEIHSVVSREVNFDHSRAQEMELHLFDLIDESAPQAKRFKCLRWVYFQSLKTPSIKLVDSAIIWSLDELYEFYNKSIGYGYEGFIIRHLGATYLRRRSPAMMKFKPKQTDHYTIISVYEAVSESGTPKGLVGGFNCIDDTLVEFSVGAGRLTHDERKRIWQQWLDYPASIRGRKLEIEYQTMSDKNHVPLFSRAVRII